MTFVEAVKVCLKEKYSTASGRANRSEFWFFILFSTLLSLVWELLLTLLAVVTNFPVALAGILNLAVPLYLCSPTISVSIRRLHDTGRSGWWYLLMLIPYLGWIILLIFYCLDSGKDNKYGVNPASDIL